MPNGIDYRLIQDIGGARARGGAQAVSQEANVAALQDYMAKQQARTAIGGETGAAGYYEQDLRRDAYTKDVESKMPFIQQMITMGDREGLEGINKGFAATHGDLHTTQLENLVPGKYAELADTQTGEALAAQFPELAQANLDPTGAYAVKSRIGVDGSVEVTGIAPAVAKEPGAADTVETGQGIFQWNPDTSRYDILVGPGKAKAGAGGAAEKWQKDALGALKTLYGTQTEMGIVVDPDRMAEYQDAMTYLADYKAKGLTANDSAVLSSRRSLAGGVDPIETVIQTLKGQDKSDDEIKALLRQSQFKSINPRLYGLK
ncbi:hypothetical protein KAR91_58455 [Candidatus Pacearchaeota archaeon]|nr:hypothetical protein [Candidatus Pacearchaeota archaeon]